MKTNRFPILLLLALATTLASCEALGDIFKAGMWMGVIVVVLVIALVLWLLRKIRR
jgi:predicted small secreted protein